MAKNQKTSAMLEKLWDKMDLIEKDIREIKGHILGRTTSETELHNKIIDTISNQNANVTNVLAEQSVALKSTFTSIWQTPQYTTLFPITTTDGLMQWESTINEESKTAMIVAVKNLLGAGGIKKNLKYILTLDLIHDYNLQGLHGKKSLNNFPKIMDILFCASLTPNNPHDFKNDMQKAIKDAKNRRHKSICLKKKQIQNEK